MTITVIAAVSENGYIGRAGDLPWRLRDDMRWFMRRTTGASVVMGRKTFETLPAPLPNRQNIVMTRDEVYTARGAVVVPSLEAALDAATAEEVFIAGGEAVYALGLSRADRIDLTRVHATVEGDARFPEVDWYRWSRLSAKRHEADEHNEHAFTIERWERKG